MPVTGQTIRTITIRGTSEGIDKLIADTKALASAEHDVALVSDDLTKRQIALAAQWRRSTLAMDEQARALDKYEQQEKLANKAVRQLVATREEADQHLARVAERYGLASAAANKMTTAMSSYALAAGNAAQISRNMVTGMSAVTREAEEQAKALTKAQAAAANSAGGRMAAGMSGSALANTNMLMGMARAGREASEAAIAAQKPLSQMVVGMSAAADTGAAASYKMVAGMSAVGKEAAAVVPQINKVTVSQADLTKQASRNAAEMLNLGRQFADVAVSMQAGQSILVVGLQQGAQIIDVIASSNRSMGQIVASAAGWAKGFATSTAGIVTGIIAIGAAVVMTASEFEKSQADIRRALAGTGAAAKLTAVDINAIAKESASLTGLSTKEASEAASTFAATGKMYGESIKAATGLTHDFATALGVDTVDATKMLAEGLTTGIAGIDKLDKTYAFLTASQREYLQDLDKNVDKTKFQTTAIEMLSNKLIKADDLTGNLAKTGTAAANTISNVFRAIGEGISFQAPTKDMTALMERLKELQRLRERIAETTVIFGPGAFGSKALEELNTQFANLLLKLGELEGKQAEAVFGKIGKETIALAEAFTQSEMKARELEKALKALEQRRAMPEVRMTMSPEQNLQAKQAADAGRVAATLARETADQEVRRNQVAIENARIYNEVSFSTAQTLAAMKDQESVAGAIGAAAQMEAQYQATINAERRKGKDIVDATATAEAQRQVTQAAINAAHAQSMTQLQNQLLIAQAITGAERIRAQLQLDVQAVYDKTGSLAKATEAATVLWNTALANVNTAALQQLQTMQEQYQLIKAVDDVARDRIKSEQTLNRLLRDNVDPMIAQQVAAQELLNLTEQRAQQEYEVAKAAMEAAQNAELQAEAQAGIANSSRNIAQSIAQTADDVDRIIAANRELARISQFIPSGIPISELFKRPGGELSQFNPAGYTSTIPSAASIFAQGAYGPGGYDTTTGAPNAQGIANVVDTYLGGGRSMATVGFAEGGGIMGAIEGLLSGGVKGAGGGTYGVTPDVLQTVSRLTALLPEEQKAGVIERELELLRATPQTIARDEMIKQLTDSLKQLNESTNSLNGTMQSVLSEYYTSDPRKSHLGFRTFAGGGIMTSDGALPLRKYQSGGIANSPQVAVYGEGSTPEAYVPLSGGHIPVKIVGAAANSNRPINVNINVNVPSGNRDEMKRGAQIMAQQLTRAMASAR